MSREDPQGVSIKELGLVMIFFFSVGELVNNWVPSVCGRIGWCEK